jgi:hypothetical protein
MIWRSGFVYAHSPLPKKLTYNKFDLVFLFAHSRAQMQLIIPVAGRRLNAVVYYECCHWRATKRKNSARVDLLHMQLSLQKCPTIMKSEPPLLLA